MIKAAQSLAAALSAAWQALVIRHLGIVGVVLAALTVTGAGVEIWDVHRRRIENGEADMRVLGTVLTENSARYFQLIDLLLRQVDSRAQTLGLDRPEAFRAEMGGRETHLFMARLIENLPAGHAINLFDAAGNTINRGIDSTNAPFNVADRAYFQYLRAHPDGGVFFDVLDPERDTGRKALVIARAISAPGHRFLGVVTSTVDLDYLLQFYRRLNLEHQIEVTLLRDDGVLLAHFPLLPEMPRAMPATSPWYRQFAAGGGVYRSPGYMSGHPLIVAVAPLSGYPLVIDVSVSEKEVLAGWWREAEYAMLAAFLLAALFVALFGLIGRQIRRQAAHNGALSRASDALRASEARLRDFVELGSDWLWEQDADLRLSWVSEGAMRLSDHSPNRLGMRRWDYQDTALDPEGWDRHRRDLEACRPFRDHRYMTAHSDKPTRFGSISGRPLFDESGTFLGYRGIGRDITAQIAAERESRDAKERAERAETLLRDAVDSISESLTIWDPTDQLVLYNEVYERRYPRAVALVKPGETFEDQMRRRIAGGEFPDAAGRETAWLAESVARHRAAAGAYERRSVDGQWMRITHRRMRDGGTVTLHVDITASKQTELALRESEARSERAQSAGGIGIWEMDAATRAWYWSPEIYRARGLDPATYTPVTGAARSHVLAEDHAMVAEWLADLENGIDRAPIEERIVRTNGEQRIHRLEGHAIMGPDGRASRLVGTVQDVTDQRMMERQLAYAQKMEAIGNLTGGMAHDFNNLLGIIVLNLDTLAMLLKDEPRLAPMVADSLNAALSGAGLTQRLLAFARRQTLAPVSVRINDMVGGVTDMLRRTLGETIEMSLKLAPDLWPVFVDPVQLEASILNLAVNARDAMPGGGNLFIATANATIDEDTAQGHPELGCGDYVTIAVTDTGIGMGPGVRERIFEPFFTTKERGHGTGLGLSMVFGFLRQSNGSITVYSEPGQGTTFHLYLPRSTVVEAREPTREIGPPPEGRGETILIAEDNATLRETLRRQLTGLNYRVLEAVDGGHALALMRTNPVALLLSDVVMPGNLDGIALARLVSVDWPDIKVVLMSGFVSAKLTEGAAVPAGTRFVQKPVRRDHLARTIREALDEPGD